MQQAPVAVEAAFQHKLKFIHIQYKKGLLIVIPFCMLDPIPKKSILAIRTYIPSPFVNALTFPGALIIQFSKFKRFSCFRKFSASFNDITATKPSFFFHHNSLN